MVDLRAILRKKYTRNQTIATGQRKGTYRSLKEAERRQFRCQGTYNRIRKCCSCSDDAQCQNFYHGCCFLVVFYGVVDVVVLVSAITVVAPW
jgi:hypothetical protein